MSGLYDQLALLPSIESGDWTEEWVHLQLSLKHNEEKQKCSAVCFAQSEGFARPWIMPVQTVAQSLSPSGRCAVHLSQDPGKSRRIQIWQGARLLQSLDVTGIHGDFVLDETLGGPIAWSRSEQRLAYVARKIHRDPTPYHLEQDWGEKLQGIQDTWIILVSWTHQVGSIKVTPLVQVPSLVGQVIFGPKDETLIYRRYNMPYRRYGIVYCPNRPCVLEQVRVEPPDLLSATLPVTNLLCPTPRSQRLSPCGKYLVFLGNDLGGAHDGCARLFKYDLKEGQSEILVDQVMEPSTPDAFPGLYLDQLPAQCWLSDHVLILSSKWRSTIALLTVDIRNGHVKRHEGLEKSAITVLSAKQGHVLVHASCPNQPPVVYRGTLQETGDLTFQQVYQPDIPTPLLTNLQQMKWEIQTFPDRSPSLEVILLAPPSNVMKRRLVVVPHGGPHSVFSANYNLLFSYYCLSGYHVLLVNYSGSSGFGQSPIVNLLGHVGESDVEETHYVSMLTRDRLSIPKDAVFVFGGSHGGFIAGHLITRYPQNYRAAIMRNPVLCIGTKWVNTDIPDFGYSECGLPYDFHQPPSPCPLPQVYELMFNKSPTAHINQLQAPILFLLGKRDRRVPPTEALQWYHYLRTRQHPVRIMMFDEDGHALDSARAEKACCESGVEYLNEFRIEF